MSCVFLFCLCFGLFLSLSPSNPKFTNFSFSLCPRMSDRKDKSKKGKDSKSSSSSSSSSPQQHATPPPPPSVGAVPMTSLQRTVEQEITRSWLNRPFSRFPIHKDIPRFIRTIMVATSAGECLYSPDPAETQAAAVGRFIKSLAMTFEPNNVRYLPSKSP